VCVCVCARSAESASAGLYILKLLLLLLLLPQFGWEVSLVDPNNSAFGQMISYLRLLVDEAAPFRTIFFLKGFSSNE
jgi:hypothetical protein